jgi:Arc/MetJ-type ribon-helix-helix transcriptional regulator
MTKTKVTVTLDADQVDAIRSLVEKGGAKSVSAFVQHAVDVSLADVAGWGALLADALEQTGGPLTRAERAWADSVLVERRPKATRRRRKSAA